MCHRAFLPHRHVSNGEVDICSSPRMSDRIPANYRSPPFPSLYWPINPLPSQTQFLFYASDIWRFTLFWTLISYVVCFGIVGIWGWVMVALGASSTARKPAVSGPPQHSRKGDGSRVDFKRHWGWSWVRGDWWYGAGWLWCVMIVGGVEAVLGGSVVGLMLVVVSDTQSPFPKAYISEFLPSSLAAIYNTGLFRMSTWIPCVWGVINILVLILSAYSLQGGL